MKINDILISRKWKYLDVELKDKDVTKFITITFDTLCKMIYEANHKKDYEKEILELKNTITKLGRENKKLKGYQDCTEQLLTANAEIFDLKRELANWKRFGDVNKTAEEIATTKLNLKKAESERDYFKHKYEEQQIVATCENTEKKEFKKENEKLMALLEDVAEMLDDRLSELI